MKKIMKTFAKFAAIALLGTCLFSCSNGDDNSSPVVETVADGVIKLDGAVKENFAAAWEGLGTTGDHTIKLGKGTYTLEKGKTFVYAGTGKITIEGFSSAAFGSDVILSGNPNTAAQNSRELFKLTGKGTLVIKNLTMKNTFGEGQSSGEYQAEVLASTNGKIVAYNSTFLSHQDTIRTEGKAWFYKCAVKGDVDFLWMEKNGVVALYENCELTAVSDRTNKAYFAAPRSNRGEKIGKGLVVLNSKVKVESGLTTVSLFRSPWNGDGTGYNQAAFVGTTIEGMTSDNTLVVNNSDGIGDNSVVGWKVDSTLAAAYPSKGANVGTLSDDDKTAEYSNRGKILNRLISIDGATTRYVTDEDDLWDVSSYNFGGIENNAATKTVNPVLSDFNASRASIKWDVSGLTFAGAKYADGTDASDGKTGFNSKAGTMPGEVLKDSDGLYSVIMHVNALNGKFAANTNSDGSSKAQAQINANTVLTVPVTAGAKVTVTATSSGTNIGINNSNGTVGSGDITYEATEIGAAAIYSFGTAYVSKITIDNLDLTQFNTPELKKYLDGTATGATKGVVITSADKSVKT